MTKHAIIMGATSGLGKGVALGLLSEGYTIGVAGRRSGELEKLKAIVELQKQFADETIIVVTHGQFARNLIAAHF